MWYSKALVMFLDRTEAGKLLAQKLIGYHSLSPFVLALPRGGVPVAFEVAQAINAHLTVVIVQKLASPYHPEYALGALAEGNIIVANAEITQEVLSETVIKRAEQEVARRVALYRSNIALPKLKDKTAIIIDDGLATGTTAQAAVQAVKKLEPRSVVLAVPVCAKKTARQLARLVDEFIALQVPEFFMAVGQWYKSFDQVTDDEVIKLLNASYHTT